MKSKSLILLILSIGFGIVAAIGISQVMNKPLDAGQAIPMGPVVVATGDLELRTELTEENVRIENWPTNVIPPEALTSLDEITDMVTMTRLSEKMVIVKNGIQHKNRSVSPVIPPNMKVVAVRVSADDTIGNLLNPGDTVDVIGVFKQRDRNTSHTTTNSRTFLKALRVYSIGNKTTIDNTETSGSSSATSIVGLLVTEKQSEALVFVQDTGSIKLVLRGDDEENDGEVGELEEIKRVVESRGEGAEPKVKAPGSEMIIYRGDNVERTKLNSDGSVIRGASGNDKGSEERSSRSGRGDYGDDGDDDRGIDDDQYRDE